MEKKFNWKRSIGIAAGVAGLAGVVLPIPNIYQVVTYICITIIIIALTYIAITIIVVVVIKLYHTYKLYKSKMQQFGQLIEVKNDIKNLLKKVEFIQNSLADLSKIEKTGEDLLGKTEQIQNSLLNLDGIEKAEDILSEINNLSSPLSNVERYLQNQSNLRYLTLDETDRLRRLLDNNPTVTKIRIICFGRNVYGEIVNHIYETHLPIKIEIIMCNPEENPEICLPSDDGKIRENCKRLLRNKAGVYVSDIPPAIRAATVYAEETAILVCVQSYEFKRENGKLTLDRPERSVIITCDERSLKVDFDGVVHYFENEYERLWQSSRKPQIKKDSKGKERVVFADFDKE